MTSAIQSGTLSPTKHGRAGGGTIHTVVITAWEKRRSYIATDMTTLRKRSFNGCPSPSVDKNDNRGEEHSDREESVLRNLWGLGYEGNHYQHEGPSRN